MTTLVDGAPPPPGSQPDGTAPGGVASVRAAVPARAAGVRLFGTQRGTGYRIPPSLAQRADGQVVQLTPLLYAVLCAVDGERDEDAIAAAVSSQVGRTVVADDVRTLIDRQLRPLGLLKGADGSEPALRKVNPLLALRFRYVVSKPERTNRITAPFAVLFHPAAVVAVTLAFAAVAYWVLFRKGLASAAYHAFANPAMLLAVFAITVGSAGFHEFGHAAALRRGGGTPGAMGAGLYLVWPAFYTDVTDSYRLGRGARLRTDLGGLYFNAVLALAMFGVWAIVGWDGLLLVVATQILQMIRQLPPLLRFDGYHILADLTGVPDLYHRIGPTLRALWPTRWRSAEARVLKPWARAVVTLWVVLVVPLLLVTALVMIATLPRILGTAAHSFDTQWGLLTDRYGHGDWAGVGAKALAMIAVALPALGVCYLVARIVRQIVRGTLRRTKGKPGRRAAAAVLAAAVVGGLVWAWWPHGNYRPIQPNERGVVQQAVMSSAGFTGHSLFPSSSTRVTASPALRPASRVTVRTVWPKDATLPSAQHPQLAMVLVPRDPSQPAWVFPFNRPAPPGPGGNQAMAIATKDGSVVYDVAFALVTTTSNTVLNRNEAYAFASCTRCAAVAVSFQVVLIIGSAQVIAPQNISAAVSYNCLQCVTAAIAIQLDVSLRSAPDATASAQLSALWTQINAFGAHLSAYTLSAIRQQLDQYEAEILQILQPFVAATSSASASAAVTGAPSGSAPLPAGSLAPAGTAVPTSPSASSSAAANAPSTAPTPSTSAAPSSTVQSGSATATPSPVPTSP